MSLIPLGGADPPFEDEAEDEEVHELRRQFEGFEPEPPIQHNTYPDSDSDREEETACHRRNQSHFDRNSEVILFVGLIFWTKDAIKETVLAHALDSGRNIKRCRHDTNKIAYCCGGENCKWKVYCSISKGDAKWQVKTYEKEHTCVPNGKCEMIKVPVIARLFLDKIRDEPEYYLPMKIEEIFKEKWKINVARPQCQAARNKAVKFIQMQYDREFARLRDYKAEILQTNPNSTVEIETVSNADGADMFRRFYVCFSVLKRSWKKYCRPLIGMDGCFLKSTMKGQLLVALGRDGNNGIYPIAAVFYDVFVDSDIVRSSFW